VIGGSGTLAIAQRPGSVNWNVTVNSFDQSLDGVAAS
jgi:hypothetical protein